MGEFKGRSFQFGSLLEERERERQLEKRKNCKKVLGFKLMRGGDWNFLFFSADKSKRRLPRFLDFHFEKRDRVLWFSNRRAPEFFEEKKQPVSELSFGRGGCLS